MRGFSFGEVNVLYNGISIGPQSITSRWMDTANLSQVEFLKGPSSLMTGLNAIGGSVNYVTRQPTSGPIQNELDLSLDSLGTVRSHFGSGGSTRGEGSRLPVRRDRDETERIHRRRRSEPDRRVRATELPRDGCTSRHSWPSNTRKIAAMPTGARRSFRPRMPARTRISGVVSGSAVSTFDGSIIAPVTIDSRTLKTNYNVLDNSTGAEELWLRTRIRMGAHQRRHGQEPDLLLPGQATLAR